MSAIADNVLDWKLETRFHLNRRTEHIFKEAGPTASQRTVCREEHWVWKEDIGVGGYGLVWLEECVNGQPRDTKVRVVKRLSKGSQSARLIDYNRELEAIIKFSHTKYRRCFVQSFGWYEDPQYIFIAMEYLNHGDLQDYLSRSPPLSAEDAAKVTFQILEGICCLHDNRFVHRDLKPRNIFLKSSPPAEWWVKIGDFGISKRVEDGLALQSTLRGTPGFLAPELLGFIETSNESDLQIAQAADMWSLGEIAFQMLTKRPAFRNVAHLSVYVRRPQDVSWNTSLYHVVGNNGVDFIKSLMSPEPARRLTANEAMAHDWMAPLRSTDSQHSSGASGAFETHNNIEIISPKSSEFQLDEPSNTWTTVEQPHLVQEESANSIPINQDAQHALNDTAFQFKKGGNPSPTQRGSDVHPPKNLGAVSQNEQEFEIAIKLITGKTVDIRIGPQTTCLDLKKKLHGLGEFPPDHQYLFNDENRRWIPESTIIRSLPLSKGLKIHVLLPIWSFRTRER